MLIATLNHNLPQLTDNLVEQLKRDPEFANHELLVLDNGSSEPKAESTTHQVRPNCYFGGGVNVIVEYFLNSTDHDYLYILNNDLIFHGPNFLSTSYEEAMTSHAAVYSPSIINASIEQCHWKQMWNWGGDLREVKWIDFQAALVHRDVLQEIVQYPAELVYGWGIDFYTGCITDKLGLKTVVSDTNTICHLNSQTFKQGKLGMSTEEFCSRAEQGLALTFQQGEFAELYKQLRSYGEHYQYSQPDQELFH